MRQLAYLGMVICLGLQAVMIVAGSELFGFVEPTADPAAVFILAFVVVSAMQALFFGVWFLTERSHVNASIGGRNGAETISLQKLRSVSSRDRSEAVKGLVNATHERSELRARLITQVLLPFIGWTIILIALGSLAVWIRINR